jgi:predicted SAM-dependent methyltransferase
MTRLNIGAGTTEMEGWTAIDRKNGQEAYPLDYADASVDEIRASHILEHFDFAQVPVVLAEWSRVLKPGGRMRLAVPDMEWIGEHSDDPMARFFLMGGQTDEDDFHRSAFTRQVLRRHMADAGLVSLASWESENGDCSSLPCSLNLQGYKPQVEAPEKDRAVKMKAVMSVPRWGANDCWATNMQALRTFGIAMDTYTGAYWDQGLHKLLQNCIDADLEWVLTLDYDTMFTADHLRQMFAIFESRSDIDALAAFQARRGDYEPLGKVFDGELRSEAQRQTAAGMPAQVDTAHFGMTLLRVEALTKVPKPWFKGDPGDDGNWGEDRIDSDIWFWHQWKKAGNTLFLAPTVRVGHLEVLVSVYDEQLRLSHMRVADWRVAHRLQQAE